MRSSTSSNSARWTSTCSSARLERATALIDELDRRLRQTRAQVEELVPRLEALAAEAGTDAGGHGDE